MSVAKYTWKNWGISLPDLKHKTTPAQFFEYEEMSNVTNDYEQAGYKDNQPKT